MRIFLIILVLVGLILPSFSFDQNRVSIKVPQTLVEAKEIGKKISGALSRVLKEVWQDGLRITKEIWQKIKAYLEAFWQKILVIFGKEIKKRKEILKEEFPKEKEELKKEIKEEIIPKTFKSLWEKFKELIK